MNINNQGKFRKAVFVVVYRRNFKTNSIEYIVLKRKKHWRGFEFPKGGVDLGESDMQTAKRETFEETGNPPIKIKEFNVKGKYLYKKRLEDRSGIIGQTFHLFSAEISNKNPVRIDKREHSRYLWLSFDKATKKLTHRNQKKCLEIVNKSLMK